MALLNISFVTRSLIRFLTEYFRASQAWPEDPPVISPQSPERLGSGELGLYLYHISEENQYKNLPPPGQDDPPVRFVPMGLSLFYQLTARGTTDDEIGAYQEQQMMGLAMKAFHDYPVIENTTQINGSDIFATDDLLGEDNRLRIVLQPINPSEAVTYWTAGTSALRLAAYYQISVVLLEPEVTQQSRGRVLIYGVHPFIGGPPRIESSRNLLTFQIPGERDARSIELRPAQVPVGEEITFTGIGLAGYSTSLLLRYNRWAVPAEADSAWDVTAADNKLTATVRETIRGERILPIVPGIYGAIISVKRQHTLSSGEIRTVGHTSNESPFAISPRIDSIEGPDSSNIVTIRGYIFRHGDVNIELQAYLGENRLTRNDEGSLDPGEFTVIDPPHGETLPVLQFRLPASLTPGRLLPVRIFVNSIESPPNWIEI